MGGQGRDTRTQVPAAPTKQDPSPPSTGLTPQPSLEPVRQGRKEQPRSPQEVWADARHLPGPAEFHADFQTQKRDQYTALTFKFH